LGASKPLEKDRVKNRHIEFTLELFNSRNIQ